MTRTILAVLIFSVAFGFVEAAVVVYLRHLLGIGFTPPHIDRSEILFLTPGIAFLEPQTAVKIIQDTTLLNIERLREAATLVILASVAAIVGRKLTHKIAFFFSFQDLGHFLLCFFKADNWLAKKRWGS